MNIVPRQCVRPESGRNEPNHSTALKAKVHIALSVTMFTLYSGGRCESSHIPPGM